VWAKPLASPASAPGPSATTVNYQGRLADSGGTPLDGTYGMSFSLWDASSGGNLMWGPESHAAVPVAEGLFSVGLGSQTSGGIPTSVWNGDRYLEIAVGGETLSPRELIRSVPIAGMALTVPDGAITSRKLDVNEAYQYVVAAEGTDSTEWTDLATLHSVNISLDVPQCVYVLYGAYMRNGDGGVSYMGISVDGQPVLDGDMIEYGGHVDWFSRVRLTGFSRFCLSAGSHTMTAKYKVHTGTGYFADRRILVFAVAQ